jgi:fatty acid desaturase
MLSEEQTEPILARRRIPDPQEPLPRLAWPTVALLVFGLALWVASSAAYLASGGWPWWAALAVNAVASYLLFTVAHDAAHHAAATDSRANRWIGRLAVPLFAPTSSFPVWRFIHMQHHRFTNHADGSDPDRYTMAGPAWQRLPRWATIDLQYLVFYWRRQDGRPAAEQREQLLAMALLLVVTVAAVATGHGWDIVVLVYAPSRLAILYLAWAFDYLPHHHLHHTPEQDRFKATRNRIGFERLLTPLLLYQNYHLVHHLHPVIPFYRYIKVWRRNEEAYLEGDPALSTAGGRELTPDEYRAIRGLVEHDH